MLSTVWPLQREQNQLVDVPRAGMRCLRCRRFSLWDWPEVCRRCPAGALIALTTSKVSAALGTLTVHSLTSHSPDISHPDCDCVLKSRGVLPTRDPKADHPNRLS